MDEATRNEILTRVDALAERLGTTAEYLWSSIVQDVMVRGWALFAGCALITSRKRSLLASKRGAS